MAQRRKQQRFDSQPPSRPASPYASGGRLPADAPDETARVQSLDELALLADREAQKLLSPVVTTGHLLLAILQAPASDAAKLLANFGADYARTATQVENLNRMDEGTLARMPMTIKAQGVMSTAYRNAAELDAPEPDPAVAERLLYCLLADKNAVAARALERLRVNPADVRARMGQAIGVGGGNVVAAANAAERATSKAPDTAVPTAESTADIGADPVAVPDLSPGGLYVLTPEQYAVFPIDGDYETAAQKKPFHAVVSYGDIHIYSGWRFKKKAYDGEGNTVFFEKERLIRESIAFVRRMGEVELGSCAENKVPDPESFEAFLRQFSINGNLASYLPAILERLGAIDIQKRAKGIHWAVPANNLPRQAPGA